MRYIRSNERKVAIQKAEVELQEKQVIKAEKEAERQEELAMSFFSQMNSASDDSTTEGRE